MTMPLAALVAQLLGSGVGLVNSFIEWRLLSLGLISDPAVMQSAFEPLRQPSAA